MPKCRFSRDIVAVQFALLLLIICALIGRTNVPMAVAFLCVYVAYLAIVGLHERERRLRAEERNSVSRFSASFADVDEDDDQDDNAGDERDGSEPASGAMMQIQEKPTDDGET